MTRRTLGLLLGPAAALALLAAPLPALSHPAHLLCGVLALVVIFWLTEAIPIPATALLGAALAVVLGVAPSKNVLSAFGDPVIFLFIGSFMLARAMEVHSLDRRIAYTLLAHPWVGAGTTRTLWALGLAAFTISMWVSNTATVAMLFPVVLAIARAGGTAHPRYTTGLLLMLAYAASVGGIATPVGTPPNLIGIALIEQGTGVKIHFLQWMAFGLPVAGVLLAACFIVIRLLFPPETGRMAGQPERMLREMKALGPWKAGERNAMIAFSTAVALWVGPGLAALALGGEHRLVALWNERIPEGIAALLAASLLFLLPVSWKRRQFTLTWEEAVRIDWGTVLLFGSGIALGKMMFDTGLAGVIGESLLSVSGAHGEAALAGASTLTAVAISETCSNTASANMIVPVMLSVAKAAGTPGVALGVAATLGASLGFMLPVSTPPNAIVYGSGAVRFTDMVRAGLLVDVIGVLVVWAAAVFWVPMVLR